MNQTLTLLKNAKNLKDISILLTFKPSALAYIAYKIPDCSKYTEFNINKKYGGVRTINSPCDRLKLLQSNLADLLQNCAYVEEKSNDEITHNAKTTLAHGFRKKYSIITNANVHIKKRYVFNIDLKDFFGSINFGRVRGFFIKDNRFKLNEVVATIIAQIACHNNALPQGSPCSPIISNLVANILDVRIAKLASNEGCGYSRYADDLTFSTNKKDFPANIARRLDAETHQWRVGTKLTDIINKSGFSINETKTRMQYKTSSQIVTGLVVNKKVNTNAKYRHKVRAMVNNLSKTLSFQMTSLDSNGNKKEEPGSIKKLNGMLSFIDSIESFNERKIIKNKNIKPKPSSARETYKQFLFLNTFFLQKLPLLICEGKTDGIYIKCALQSLAKSYPTLIDSTKETDKLKIKIFKFSKTIEKVLGINGGCEQIKNLIIDYLKIYKELDQTIDKGKIQPLIILVDNDTGPNGLFKYIIKNNGIIKDIDSLRKEKFIKINPHLYIIPTPLINGKYSSIEDFFYKKTLSMEYEGRTFCKDNNCETNCSNNTQHYGKNDFAVKVILPNKRRIYFHKFRPILNIIKSIV